MKLSEGEKNQILDAVLNAEKRTNGEIVPVIVKSSDLYPSAHFRWSIIIAFIFILTTYWVNPIDDIFYIYSFITGSVIGYFLALVPYLKKLVITEDQIEEEFRQKAMESFLVNGVTQTKNRNGVQLFISAFEQKAMIISDIGIKSKLGNETWEKVISDMIPLLKKRQYSKAIIEAIEEIGIKLAEQFPDSRDDKDELPNKLVIEI